MGYTMQNIIYRDEGFAIIGAAYAVANELGCGFLESVYQECLVHEFILREIPFQTQPELNLCYKGNQLHQTFRPDFICYDKIIIELKAVKELHEQHQAQVLNYLKATGYHLGLLINFGESPLKSKRVVH